MTLRLAGGSLGLLVLGAMAAVALGGPALARDLLVPAAAFVFAMAVLFLLVTDKRKLFFFIFIARAACDPLFDAMKSDAGPASMGVGALLNALMVLIACLYLLRRPRTASRIVLPMWAAFLLAALASAAMAPEFSNAIRLFLVQVSYCAVFAIAFYLVRSQADVRTCMHALIWSSVLPVLYALIELAPGAALMQEEFRLKSTFSHPNIFAFYLVLIIAVILYVQKAGGALVSKTMRWKLWLYMGLLLGLLVLTKTRSAWAGCLLIFATYGFFFQRRFLLYALLVPMLVLLDAGVRERLLDLTADTEYGNSDNLNSYAWRLLLWQAGLGWMRPSHALFGYGLDSFKFYSPLFFPLEGRDSWDPHNVYVQLFFETGLAGLLSYGWMFARLLGHLKRGAAQDKAGTTILMSMVLAYLVISYSDNMLYYLAFNWYFWFFMGTACAAQAAQRTQPLSGIGHVQFASLPTPAARSDS